LNWIFWIIKKLKEERVSFLIAYVLGQMQHEAAIPQLVENLEDLKESAMVRHECAEALGSIAKDQCLTALEKYSKDQERVVKESCVVALDMYNYEQSKDFQYADSLVKMKETWKSNN